jgi:hypothetical protein
MIGTKCSNPCYLIEKESSQSLNEGLIETCPGHRRLMYVSDINQNSPYIPEGKMKTTSNQGFKTSLTRFSA